MLLRDGVASLLMQEKVLLPVVMRAVVVIVAAVAVATAAQGRASMKRGGRGGCVVGGAGFVCVASFFCEDFCSWEESCGSLSVCCICQNECVRVS